MLESIRDNLRATSMFIEAGSAPPILVNVVILEAVDGALQRQNRAFTYGPLYARLGRNR